MLPDGATLKIEVGLDFDPGDRNYDTALDNRLVPDISATRLVAELLSPDVTGRVEAFDRRVIVFFEENPQIVSFQRETHPKGRKENKTL